MSIEAFMNDDHAASRDWADRVVLDAARENLRITWADGSESSITAAALRTACRCAWCTQERRAGAEHLVSPTLRFDGISLHGPETLHPVFTDGHRTGLFPLVYVRSLTPACVQPGRKAS